MSQDLRNICIIAHVDHGKTTLVDHLLKQAGTFQAHETQSDRMMDSMDLERERGITILAKNTSVTYRGTKINIVDTPGHADFGGEVERIMGMVDGAILLVDGAEGPLPQTRFVLQKALACGHRVILCINKVDRPECAGGERLKEVVNQTFDLFVELGATDEQADFPIIYACGRDGWCTLSFDQIPSLLKDATGATLESMFDVILKEVPAPKIGPAPGFQMMLANLSYSDYLGQLGIGRVLSGEVRKNQKAYRRGIDANGNAIDEGFQVTRLMTFQGLNKVEVESLEAGEIGIVAGTDGMEIGDTITTDLAIPALPRIKVDKPTIAMIFSINTSPLSGREGEAIQSRKLRDRLLREVRHNVALRMQDTDVPDQFRVLGRGELQFAILIEQMRRENFEFMVGKPLVIYKKDDAGERLEPMERLVLDLPADFASAVTKMFQERKGLLTKYESAEGSPNNPASARVRLEFEIPTRGLLGMRSHFLTVTKGMGLMSSEILGYQPHKGDIPHRTVGALISDRSGETVEYALLGLEDRGTFFMGPGVPVYEGMIIGESTRDDDMNVNPCREKKLTNIRAASAEILVTLAGIRKMSLEDCLEWIDEDEWIEVTPKSIRLRKKVLPGNERSVKRAKRIQ